MKKMSHGIWGYMCLVWVIVNAAHRGRGGQYIYLQQGAALCLEVCNDSLQVCKGHSFVNEVRCPSSFAAQGHASGNAKDPQGQEVRFAPRRDHMYVRDGLPCLP